nr:replication initiator protein A [uncultured Oscillibacter sp.]
MPDMKLPSYFYGDEAMQFTYFRIPCQLITHPRFKHLSTDSKLLYGMLLDRMSLSIKNEWYDDTGRVYIYYTVDEVCSNLNCGRDKAMRLLAELDTGKGVGLIERKKQGQGKPTRIYVKRFTTQEIPPQPEKKPEPPAPPPGVEFADVQTSDFPTSRRRKNPPQEVEETDPNQTKRNQLDFIQPDPSIYPPAPSGRQMGIDRCEVREEVKENIEYEHLRQELPYDDVESLLELIVDVLSSTASTIRIGGEVLPVDAVRRRFRPWSGGARCTRPAPIR